MNYICKMCASKCEVENLIAKNLKLALKKFLIIAILFIGNFAFQSMAAPDEPPAKTPPVLKPTSEPNNSHTKNKPAPPNLAQRLGQHPQVIKDAEKVYDALDLSNAVTPLNKEVFVTAFVGYRNLLAAGRNPNSNILSICDFTLSSNVPRLWVIDLARKKLLYNTLVAHGQGTGEEYATKFSNRENSHQSSIGFYITDSTYYGANGYSLRLHGMDEGFNHNALQRAIVIHGAHYVSEEFIKANNRLGRSWGCPALPQELNRPIIDRIKEGSVFYIHYPQPEYLASSTWIRTPIDKSVACPFLPTDKRNTHSERKQMAYYKPQSTDTLMNANPTKNNTSQQSGIQP